MNQNGFEPQNRPGFGQQNPYPAGGYTGPAGGAPNGGYPTGAFGNVPGNAQGYMPQNSGYPGGYPAGNATQTGGYASGYSQGPAGTNTGYNSYAPYANPYQGSMAPGYPPRSGAPGTTGMPGTYFSGYSAGQMSQSYQPANPLMQGYPPQNASAAPSTGSFIPQTPYSTSGYQPPVQDGSQTGQNAYAQMGRAPQKTGSQQAYREQVPLNGGGYVPQYVPVRKREMELPNYVLLIAGGLMILLFILAVLVFNNSALKILFLALAAGTTAFLWIKPVTESNNRLCYSVIAVVLCFITVVSFIPFNRGGNGSPDPVNSQGTAVTSPAAGSTVIQSTSVPGGSASYVATETTPSPEDEEDIEEVKGRLYNFFVYWQGNRLEEMLSLCSPSWVSKRENPRSDLFTLLRNRTPVNFTLENITGTSADTSRKVILVSSIDRNDGNPPKTYRLTVLMSKENGEWFIDPESLVTNDELDTPDPNITPTPGPTPTPYTDGQTVLYYNPDGGEMYHRDPNCRTVLAKYTPLQGHFNYSQVNDPPYSELKPCTVCGSPLR